VKKLFRSGGKIDFIQVGLALIFMLVIGLFTLSIYWLIFDDNPAVDVFDVSLYQDADTKVHELVVKTGEDFQYGIDFCKHTTAPATIRTTWIDELVYTEPIEAARHPANISQECGHMHILKTIPKTLLPADYKMRVTLEYKVNPIAHRYVTYEVGNLIVVKGDE